MATVKIIAELDIEYDEQQLDEHKALAYVHRRLDNINDPPVHITSANIYVPRGMPEPEPEDPIEAVMAEDRI
jgi:hypothetical protein